MVDPATGLVVSPASDGASTLLDKWTIEKPNLRSDVAIALSASEHAASDGQLIYSIHLSNVSPYALNGAQVRLCLSGAVSFAGTPSDTTTVQDDEIVVTVGRLDQGASQDLSIPMKVAKKDGEIEAFATLTSSTARPIHSNHVETSLNR